MKTNVRDLPEGCGGNISRGWVEASPYLEKPSMSRTPAVANKRHTNDIHSYILKVTDWEHASIRERVKKRMKADGIKWIGVTYET